MNYKQIYNSLIQKGLERGLNKGILDYYTELHHIIPKSMGGKNKKENYVLLTAKEHFIAHQLLYKIYKNSQMAFALHKFCNGTYEQRINSRKYDWIKTKVRKIQSETSKNSWSKLDDIGRLNRAMNIGKGVKAAAGRRTSEDKILISKNIKDGRAKWEKSLTDEELNIHWSDVVEKRNSTLSNKSDEWHSNYKEKISKGVLSVDRKICPHCSTKCDVGNYAKYHGDNCKIITGKNHIRSKLTCPHCGIEMDKSHAKRYHFDNCKRRDN